jgi:hypothetical protein
LCGDKASTAQIEAYKVAYDLVRGCIELIKPEAYRAQQYGVIVRGIGTDDEPPNIPFPGDPHTDMPAGEFRENLVLAVECYAGKLGLQDGVKLEDESG